MADESSGPAEDYSQENLDEVLLTEVEVAGSRQYIVYRNGAVVDAAELEHLCDKVGWPRRPLNKVQAALANSFLVSALFLEAQPPASSTRDEPSSSDSSSSSGSAPPPGSRLIGLARCTSDGAFNATIWDVLVDPEFQGQVGMPCLLGSSPFTCCAVAFCGLHVDLGRECSSMEERTSAMRAPGRWQLALPLCNPAITVCPTLHSPRFHRIITCNANTPLRGLQGLGKALVEGMTRTLLRREVTNITLFADANGEPGLLLRTEHHVGRKTAWEPWMQGMHAVLPGGGPPAWPSPLSTSSSACTCSGPT